MLSTEALLIGSLTIMAAVFLRQWIKASGRADTQLHAYEAALEVAKAEASRVSARTRALDDMLNYAAYYLFDGNASRCATIASFRKHMGYTADDISAELRRRIDADWAARVRAIDDYMTKQKESDNATVD